MDTLFNTFYTKYRWESMWWSCRAACSSEWEDWIIQSRKHGWWEQTLILICGKMTLGLQFWRIYERESREEATALPLSEGQSLRGRNCWRFPAQRFEKLVEPPNVLQGVLCGKLHLKDPAGQPLPQWDTNCGARDRAIGTHIPSREEWKGCILISTTSSTCSAAPALGWSQPTSWRERIPKVSTLAP